MSTYNRTILIFHSRRLPLLLFFFFVVAFVSYSSHAQKGEGVDLAVGILAVAGEGLEGVDGLEGVVGFDGVGGLRRRRLLRSNSAG